MESQGIEDATNDRPAPGTEGGFIRLAGEASLCGLPEVAFADVVRAVDFRVDRVGEEFFCD